MKKLPLVLVLVVTTMFGSVYSPTAIAKDHSNSNSDDDNNNKNSDDQSGKHQKSSSQYQKGQPNWQYKSNKFDNSQSAKFPPNNQFQFNNQVKGLPGQSNDKSPWQNYQKPNSGPQAVQKNVQLQVVQNKPDWIDKSHKDHKEVKNFVVKFGGPEPFTAAWYHDHPHAWHYHHDDAWKIVTAASVIGFLGWEAYHPHGVVVYEPVPYDTLFYTRPGVIIDPSRGEWMPLGQFSLMMGPGDNGTRMLDLASDRFGHIRGSYFDVVSGASYNVAGIIDPRTQYAQWSLESNRQMTFYTPLGEMMQPQGLVYVQFPNGERQQWQLVRMDGGY